MSGSEIPYPRRPSGRCQLVSSRAVNLGAVVSATENLSKAWGTWLRPLKKVAGPVGALAFIDHPHTTAAQLFDDAVVRDYLVDH